MVLVIVMGALTGCGDNRPLNHRALVLAMGFAPASHGRVTVYFQMPTPSGLKGISASSGTGSAGSAKSSTYIVTGTGATVARAFSIAQGLINQDMYLGQLQAIILSTHLSRLQFESVVSVLLRIGSLDKTPYALAATAPIAQVLSATPPTAVVSPLYYSTEFRCAHCQTVNLKRTIWDVERLQYTPTQSLWLPVVNPTSRGLQIDTVALYRGDRVERVLTPHQTMLLGWVLGRTTKGTVELRWDGLPVSVRALKSRPQLTAQWRGSQLHLTVQLRVTGDVDAFPLADQLGPHLPWLEATTSDRVSSRILRLMMDMGGAGVDPFDWGNAYLWIHPGEATRWDTAYPHAIWTVRVHTIIRVIGDAT